MYKRSNEPGGLMIFIVVAIVGVAAYFLWTGLIDVVETGGEINAPLTREAATIFAATALSQPTKPIYRPEPVPTRTPEPPCQEFIVTYNGYAAVRDNPALSDPAIAGLPRGTRVCVWEHLPASGFYLVKVEIDGRDRLAYMNEAVIEAVNPTFTPSNTFTPLPSITPRPTDTPSRTPTRDPQVTPSQTPTPPPTPTVPPLSA